MADDPSLLCRVRRKNHLHRIVVDAAGRVSPQARVFCDEQASSSWLVTSRACSVAKRERYAKHGARVWVLPSTRGRIALGRLLSRLGKEGILHVVCEGGGQLAASIVRQRLADEYYFFLAPIVLGGNGTPGIAGPGWRLSGAPLFAISSVERLGDDILLRAIPEPVKGRS